MGERAHENQVSTRAMHQEGTAAKLWRVAAQPPRCASDVRVAAHLFVRAGRRHCAKSRGSYILRVTRQDAGAEMGRPRRPRSAPLRKLSLVEFDVHCALVGVDVYDVAIAKQ